MNKEKMEKEFFGVLEKMSDMMKRKNHDYAKDDGDAYRNMRIAEEFGITTLENGILVRMCDKISRIDGFVKEKKLKVEDEKISDTLLDLAVYSILLLVFVKNKKGNNDEDNFVNQQTLNEEFSKNLKKMNDIVVMKKEGSDNPFEAFVKEKKDIDMFENVILSDAREKVIDMAKLFKLKAEDFEMEKFENKLLELAVNSIVLMIYIKNK